MPTTDHQIERETIAAVRLEVEADDIAAVHRLAEVGNGALKAAKADEESWLTTLQQQSGVWATCVGHLVV